MSEINRAHVYKCGEGEPEHEMTPACWCNPVLAHKEIDGEVWVHKERKEIEQ